MSNRERLEDLEKKLREAEEKGYKELMGLYRDSIKKCKEDMQIALILKIFGVVFAILLFVLCFAEQIADIIYGFKTGNKNDITQNALFIFFVCFIFAICILIVWIQIKGDEKKASKIREENSRLPNEIRRLQNCRGNYIAVAKKNGCGDEMEAYYNDFQTQVEQYMLQTYDTVLALGENQKAIESHKIDPYIAGGAANALGGPIMGVAAGISASEHNKKVEDNRTYYAQSVRANKMYQDSMKRQLESIIKSINDLYDSCTYK